MRWINLIKLFVILYIIFTIFVVYRLYKGKRSQSKEISSYISKIKLSRKPKIEAEKSQVNKEKAKPTVEIWGKAAIGLYFWKHIFEAPLENLQGELSQFGELKFDSMNMKFRTGALVTPDSVNRETKHAVLVINGREENKVKFAKSWLDALKGFPDLQNLAVILLGNEQCDNDWLMEYMTKNGGIVNLAFIVYDIPYTDNNLFHQWPLGVATYRKFPLVPNGFIKKQRRTYKCNFLGTVYKDSSREELVKIINSGERIKKNCFTKFRYDWLPNESKETSELYQNVLRNSELTLCPVGVNTECYRIYEAISFGSVPVVEDVMTPGNCGRTSNEGFTQTPLRILKELKAPLIYVTTWKELPGIIDRELQMSMHDVLERRYKLLRWYQKFKYELRNRFLAALKKSFEF